MSRRAAPGGAELPAGPRPAPRDTPFFDDAIVDQLLRALVTVTMELSVTRDRLDALERMLEQQAQLDRTALDHLVVAADVGQARSQRRRDLVASVLGPLVAHLGTRGGGNRDGQA